MLSTFPSTPGRGRSRFLKALPERPPGESTIPSSPAPAPAAIPTEPTLPSLPKMSIPRRPVGAQANHARALSIASVSSVYSDSPGLSRSLSNSSSYNTKDSLSGIDSETGPTPPLPPKDKQGQQSMPRTPNILSSPISSQPSPPQPEIWRRRPAKSDRSISFPVLKLDKSNGSTASPPKRQEQPVSGPQLPRSVSGRRKPVPSRPAPSQPDLMGNKLAKLGNKNLGETSQESRNDELPKQLYPSFKRLPTPEYLKTDKRQPSTPKVLSPISPPPPSTPPEDVPPELPRKSESRVNRPTAAPTLVLPEPTNRPNIPTPHSQEPSEALTVMSEPTVMRSPQPKKAFAARILTPQPSPGDKASPLTLPSPTGLGIHFPTVSTPPTPGSICPGLPLSDVHFDCFQSHKFMRSSKNTLYPIACMVCKKKDSEMRWKCSWCCLSACGSCMQVLASLPGKDLRVCLERIGR
jgi:hypothetical protein